MAQQPRRIMIRAVEENVDVKSLSCAILSRLYALLVIMCGVALPLSPMISNGTVTKIIPITYFCALFTIAIAFLVYVHCYLLKDIGKTSPRHLRNIKYPMSVYSVTKDFEKKCNTENDDVINKRDNICINEENEDTDTDSTDDLDKKEGDPYEHVFSPPIRPPTPMVTTFRHGEANYPNFYLRVGSVVFGSGIMLYCGLNIAKWSHDVTCGWAGSIGYWFILINILQFIFTFYQLYFMFRHNKISINVHRSFARFGLMHIVATNVCSWLLILIRETEEGFRHISKDVQEQQKQQSGAESNGHVATSTGVPDTCSVSVMDPILTALQPYLFPCIIQYSLIMAASIYTMCDNIGLHERLLLRRVLTGTKPTDEEGDQVPITCHQSYHGLFSGIGCLILTAIGIVLFNVLRQKPHLSDGAMILYFTMEFLVLALLIFGTSIAWYQLQNLAFDPKSCKKLDTILLIVSLIGVYLFDTFCLIHAVYNKIVYQSVLGILRPLFSSIQATLQMVAIFDGGHRYTDNTEHFKTKPGRGFAIFILMLNLSLWAMYTFQARTTFSDHAFKDFFNGEAWVVVTHLSIPLMIFFRFHSTTCLYEIWKHAYARQKPHSV